MKVKNILTAFGIAAGFCLLSAFGGEKITMQDQLKKIDEIVSDNVAAFTAKKRATCKAMALQKAIGIAEAQLAAAVPTKKVTAPVTKTTKTPAKTTTKKAPAPVKPAPPAPPAPKKEETTTGRRNQEPAPSTPVKPEERTTGRRGGGL